MGQIIGASIQASAAKSAAQTQSNAAMYASDRIYQAGQESNALQKQMFDTTQNNQAPFLAVGDNGILTLNDMVSRNTLTPTFQPQAFQAQAPTAQTVMAQDPGYQFGLDQGMQGLQRQLAAGGNAGGGAALKAAAQYTTDYASTHYNDAYNRYMQGQQFAFDVNNSNNSTLYNAQVNNDTMRFNQLASLAGTGQTAANFLGNAGQNYANASNNNLMSATNQANQYSTSAANAIAAGKVGAANAWNNGIAGTQNNMNEIAMLAMLGGA